MGNQLVPHLLSKVGGPQGGENRNARKPNLSGEARKFCSYKAGEKVTEDLAASKVSGASCDK